MRREVKSSRISVHRADAVVRGPAYRTRLTTRACDAIALPISNPAGTKSVARPLLASPATNRRARGRVRISSSQCESSRVAGAAPCNSRKCLGSFHTKRRRGEVQRRQFELKGVAGGY